jgi:hypothetical protein
MSYLDFLESKIAAAPQEGGTVSVGDVHGFLHEWQREIVAWAVGVGRAAVWADTGLGKTVMMLEWARLSGSTSLIVAPLAVCQQTSREALNRLGMTAKYVRDQSEVTGPGVWITSYEMIEHFDPAQFDAVALDEASILKNSTGKMRDAMIAHFASVPHRLACTATPAPNDPEELTNQAEFLGQSTRTLMLAAYFVHDQDGWRLKGHARRPMIEWMATWALAIRRPSDMGYPDEGYVLPGLTIEGHIVEAEVEAEGQLFATDLGGVGGRAKVRKETLHARCAKAAELVAAEPDEPWVLWAGLNDEADELTRMIPGAVNVHGSLSPEEKSARLLGFADGDFRVIVTKPGIASMGLNWQHCARMAFVGLSDSYEQYYQSIRRCYRYGQSRVVEAHVIVSELESQIVQNVKNKEQQATGLTAELVAEMRRVRTTGRSVA